MIIRGHGTRFAPSPTGYMHIGNLRTALYAYLIARHYGGRLVLRIEDTDRRRNVEDAVQVIYDSLQLAGLDYDEGPTRAAITGLTCRASAGRCTGSTAERLVELGRISRLLLRGSRQRRRARPSKRGKTQASRTGRQRATHRRRSTIPAASCPRGN